MGHEDVCKDGIIEALFLCPVCRKESAQEQSVAFCAYCGKDLFFNQSCYQCDLATDQEIQDELALLRKEVKLLNHLRANGVDSWEGYSEPE